MRVSRTLLYAGIFLVAIGGVLVAADLGLAGEPVLTGTLGLWPLAIIAVGLGLVLRHTRISLSGGLLAAAVPGLLIGSAFAMVPRFSGSCGAVDQAGPEAVQQGAFDGPANVSIVTDCGSLVVDTAAGSSWRLASRNSERRAPIVHSSTQLLSIAPADHEAWVSLGRDDWNLTLPTSEFVGMSLVFNAGRGDLDLAGTSIDRLSVTANASDVVIDASEASITSLTGVVNLGQLSIQLPASSDPTGSLTVGAGNLKVCAPPELGLRITASGDAREIKVAGQHMAGPIWQSAGYESAAHRADLVARIDLGALEINPIGGCK